MVDYKKVKLKAGLEIHQQLVTGKLFSRTPSYLRSDKPDYEIVRKLHKVAGESGEVDVAVEHEAAKGKEFIYQGYDDSISLVELDEAPPREMDHEALDVAIQIALLLNCKIYQTAQIMRKTVIDGSNTSGFQRTEEDAARVVSRDKKRVVFRLDRLGIPLVEITTKPVLDTAEKIKETALKIGEILRAARVKRGIGTIRQDVNISTKGHGRVEIKGFQDPKTMIKTFDLEIDRQQKELKKNKKIGEVRKALRDGSTDFLRPLPGEARMYPETDLPLLRISRNRIDRLKKRLPKLRSDIKAELKRSGLPEELISLIINFGNVDEFNILMKHCKDASLVGKMVSLWRSEFAKKTGKSFDEIKGVLNESVLEEILLALKSEKVSKGDVQGIMAEIARGKKVEDALKMERVGDDEIEEKIAGIIKKKPGLRANAYMGLVMKEFKGRVNVRKAMETIKKILGDK